MMNSCFPSEHNILKVIQDNDGKLGKREIAKHFNLSLAQKDDLKASLKSMRKSGLILKGPGNLYHIISEDTPIHVYGTICAHLEKESYRVKLESGHDMIAYNCKYKNPLVAGERVAIKISRVKKKNKGRTGKITKRLSTDTHGRILLGIVGLNNGQYYLRSVAKKNHNDIPILKEDTDNLDVGDLIHATFISKDELRHMGMDPRRLTCKLLKIIRKNVSQAGKTLGVIALNEHNMPIEFPEAILNNAQKITPISSSDQHKDMTDIPFITIDPATARDHDDAVAAFQDKAADNPNGYIVHVAIADVAYYVRSGGAIDMEARKRGNSIYLPDQVVPMLPETLSNDLCSLREGTERPALVMTMRFSETGRKLSHKVQRGMIKCKSNLSYEEVFRVHQGTQEEHLVKHKDILQDVFDAYACVKKARDKRSPLNLDMAEYEIELNDQGDVINILQKERLFTHQLIEEFMVLANVCAAETLEKRKSTVIYRSHEAPPADKASQLKETLKEMDFSFSVGQVMKPRAFNGILAQAKESEFKDLINKLVLRCQCQAVYSTKNEGHFGLNLARYAHFTSPIRRYADLFIHRALITALDLGDDGLTEDDVENAAEIADHISKTERKAMQVEIQTRDRYLARFMENKIGNHFRALISGVTTAGLFIKIPEYGAEGIIPISDLSVLRKRYFIYDDKKHMLVDRRTGDYYVLGQTVNVVLKEAVPITGGMRFDLLDEKDLLPANRQKHKHKKGSFKKARTLRKKVKSKTTFKRK
ncbi:MAG: VacB/RNase II family 3'-5' exoribonuclease [Pseudomonadota bacterium]